METDRTKLTVFRKIWDCQPIIDIEILKWLTSLDPRVVASTRRFDVVSWCGDMNWGQDDSFDGDEVCRVVFNIDLKSRQGQRVSELTSSCSWSSECSRCKCEPDRDDVEELVAQLFLVHYQPVVTVKAIDDLFEELAVLYEIEKSARKEERRLRDMGWL